MSYLSEHEIGSTNGSRLSRVPHHAPGDAGPNLERLLLRWQAEDGTQSRSEKHETGTYKLSSSPLSLRDVLQLQARAGNKAVQRLIDRPESARPQIWIAGQSNQPPVHVQRVLKIGDDGVHKSVDDAALPKKLQRVVPSSRTNIRKPVIAKLDSWARSTKDWKFDTWQDAVDEAKTALNADVLENRGEKEPAHISQGEGETGSQIQPFRRRQGSDGRTAVGDYVEHVLKLGGIPESEVAGLKKECVNECEDLVRADEQTRSIRTARAGKGGQKSKRSVHLYAIRERLYRFIATSLNKASSGRAMAELFSREADKAKRAAEKRSELHSKTSKKK